MERQPVPGGSGNAWFTGHLHVKPHRLELVGWCAAVGARFPARSSALTEAAGRWFLPRVDAAL